MSNVSHRLSMREIDREQLRESCRRANLAVADQSLGIGRELTYREGPRRTIVVHFAHSDFPAGFEATLGALISLESSWTIVPRYQEGAVAEYDTSELPALISRCVAHLPWAAPDKSDDLYLIGKSGTALIAYDHHGLDDGMPIFLLNTESAEDFLTVLNQRGAEFELFSRDG